MDLGSLTDDELQHLKEISWDDWNFGSGKKLSLELVNEIEEEQERRRTIQFVGSGVTVHAANSPPASPKVGAFYFDLTDNVGRVYDGKRWIEMSGIVQP